MFIYFILLCGIIIFFKIIKSLAIIELNHMKNFNNEMENIYIN
jgi:hypothetical protein